MAEHQPRMAAEIVERMVKKGLQPDAVTYGTVMHHALNHGDMELVEDMIGRVRETKNTQLTLKSVVSLVRASVTSEAGLGRRSKLSSVFNIIKSIGRSTVVATPHIGRYLVFVSLRTDDPVMAFKFWDFLLKTTRRGATGSRFFSGDLLRSAFDTIKSEAG
ncbi:hypothetical protein B0H10DRAFT_2216806 [Mycena sp. CBHHK59/15]|nr:hypothetical protein B0H10DRAFT_2216806 [Mycena sp. CBHHK59/15]